MPEQLPHPHSVVVLARAWVTWQLDHPAKTWHHQLLSHCEPRPSEHLWRTFHTITTFSLNCFWIALGYEWAYCMTAEELSQTVLSTRIQPQALALWKRFRGHTKAKIYSALVGCTEFICWDSNKVPLIFMSYKTPNCCFCITFLSMTQTSNCITTTTIVTANEAMAEVLFSTFIGDTL